MSYVTLADLEARFGTQELTRLTDRADPPAGAIDQAVTARAIVDTAALIDGYVRARYVTPLSPVPAQITDLALAIAFYKLHRWEPDQKVRRDYEDAIRALRDIASGTIHLTSATVTPATTGGTGARVTDRARPLTAQNLQGFI